MGQENWGHVIGEDVKPEATAANAPAIAAWVKKDRKAMSQILIAIGTEQAAAYDDLDTAKEIWDRIIQTYESGGPARKTSLLKKLISMRLREGDDVVKHITEFNETVKRLREANLEIIEEMLVILLLNSLPETYEVFRTSIETQKELPKLEELRIKIIEFHEGHSNKEDKGQGALYAKPSHGGRPRQNGGKPGQTNYSKQRSNKFMRDVECFKCHKKGHIAKYCPEGRKMASVKNVIDDSDNRQTMLSIAEQTMYVSSSETRWCLDSGATSHLCNSRASFEKFEKRNAELGLANKKSTRILGTGNVPVKVKNKQGEINFENVSYVPDLRTNLLSVAKATDHGYTVTFDKNEAVIADSRNRVVLRAQRRGNLYFVNNVSNKVNSVSGAMTCDEKTNINKWHEKLGHLNERDLKLMSKKGLVYGLDIKDGEKLSECEVCIREKQTRLPFPKAKSEKASKLLEIVHSDVCGPMRHASAAEKKYFVTFIDDKSRWCETYFIKNKSEVLTKFKEYKQMAELQTGCKIKALQSDNGKEYCNREFDTYLKEHGIVRRLSAPHTPQQNGVAERKNRTLVEMARCMMRQAEAPPHLWAEAIHNANYTRNRCPTSALDGGIPYSEWTGKIPTVRHMQVFGTKVFVLDKTQTRGKFESRSQPGIFLGYAQEAKAYRIYFPQSRSTIVSRDVKFVTGIGFKKQYQEILEDIDEENELEIVIEEMPNQEPPSESIRRQRKRGATVTWENHVVPRKRGRGRPKLLRTGSVGRPRKLYSTAASTERETEEEEDDNSETEREQEDEEMDDDVFDEEAQITVTENPTTWSQASKSSDAESWRIALEDEMLAQIKNQTWEITQRPKHKKVIGSRYVFCTKYSEERERKKVRLVAKGCSQRPGEDFTETFSLVVRSTSVRILAAVAAEYGLQIHQMDVITAYLNGELEEEVFMEVPECLREIINKIVAGEPVGSDGKVIRDEKIINTAKRWGEGININSDAVCKLIKALYGLRQSGAAWHKVLVDKLIKLGFKPIPQDRCMFVSQKNGKTVYIAIYVDDILIAGDDEEWISTVKKELSKSFETKDLGLVSKCLGIEFERDGESRVYMKQRQYTKALINKFYMSECKPVATPIEIKSDLVKPKIACEREMKRYPYQSLIGGLLYLSVTTRPDIAYAVNFLSQFNTAYDRSHWKAARRVLKYLKGTINYGLMYERTDLALFGLVDANYGGRATGQKSYTGYSFMLAGCTISWDARKQKTVTLSSTEAEYMAMSEATKEALYLRGMLDEMGIQDKNEKIVLFNDNQSAIKMIVNNVYHARTKHIDVRHHFIRDEYEKGVIDVIHMRTEDMPADVLTKGLSAEKHYNCTINMGMVEA